MSGGSYNYLNHVWELDDLLRKQADVEQMAERLAGLSEAEFPGATAAAALTYRLHEQLRLWEIHAMAQYALVEKVWHAVEWWDSSDSGPDRVRDELARLITPPTAEES